MSRFSLFIAALTLAASFEVGSAVVAKAQNSAMDRCVAACKQQHGKRCDHWCEGRTAGRQ
jgi:hypothetical protein